MKFKTVLLFFLMLFISSEWVFAIQEGCENCKIMLTVGEDEANWGFYKNDELQSLDEVEIIDYVDSIAIDMIISGELSVDSLIISMDGVNATDTLANHPTAPLSLDYADNKIVIKDGKIITNSSAEILDLRDLNTSEKLRGFFYRIITSVGPIRGPEINYIKSSSDSEAVTNPGNNQAILIPENINFLPPYYSEKSSEKSALNQSQNNLLHYILIYDFRSGTLVPLTREGEAIKGKVFGIKDNFRVRPSVGRTIGLYYTNLNTTSDSLAVKFEFKDFHTDGAESFISNVGAFTTGQTVSDPGETGADIDEGDSDAELQGGGDADDITPQQKNRIAMYNSLADQLKKYYQARASTGFINANQFNTEIEFIEANIKKYLGVDIVTGSAILNSGKNFAESLDLENNELLQSYRDSVLNNSKHAAESWSKIKNSLIYSWGDIQIKNQDTFILELQRYRNNKPLTSQPTSYEFLTKGGLKIDFSTGFFLTGLKDDSFITQNVQDTVITTSPADTSIVEKDKILKKDTGNFDVGAGALMHIYPRTGHRWGASLSAGFIVDSDIATKLLGGVSLLFGKEKRVVLSGGMAIGKVERLGTGLNEGDIIDIGENQTTEVPTRDVWKNNWFFGLTYNF